MSAVALGDIADFVMGQAPPGASCNEDGSGTPFVKAGEFGEQRPIIREWTTRPLQFAKETDILVCVVGATAGKLNLGADCAIGRSVGAVRPRPGRLDQMFAYHFLKTQTLKLRGGSQGSAQGVITRGMLENLQVPDMPLAEQRRIADILDKADAIRRKRKEAIALTEELLRSAFLEMFGDPVTNPKGWPVKTVDELEADFSYGTSTKCTADDDGHAVLRIPNVVGGEIDYSDLKYAKLDDGEVRRFSLVRGDIVFVRSNGNPNYIARAAVFRDAKPMLFASYLIRARLPDRCPVTPEFVHSVFSADSFREQLLKEATTTAGNYNINTKGLGRQRMPVPPLGLQERFIAVLDHIRAARGRQEHYRKDADGLFNSLVARAFSGMLEQAR